MKNKAAAILLIFTMTASVFGGTYCAAEVSGGKIQGFVTAASSMSAGDRKTITDALIPLLITNTGIDALKYYINAYNPSSTQIFDIVVGKILSFTDKETALSILEYLRCIDESIRSDYLLGLQSRSERELSPRSQKALGDVLEKQYSAYDGLEKIFTEDQITVGVIARLLESVYKMNDSKPLLTDGADGFAVMQISDALRDTIQKAAQTNPDTGIGADEFAAGVAEFLNGGFSAGEKVNLKTVLAEIGVYSKSADTSIPGSGAGGAVATPVPEIKDAEQSYIGYEILESSDELGYDIIEIFRYKGSEKDGSGEFEKPEVVSISVSSESAMLYKIEESGLVPVKYTTCDNGVLKCRIESAGKYALSIMTSHFTDVNGWGAPYIEALYNRGVISGKSDDLFAPEDNITREEFVKLVVETADISTENERVDFADVVSGQWYEKFIAAAYNNGIVNGVGDGRFGIGECITRQDMAKILYGVLSREGLLAQYENGDAISFADENEIAPYAKEAVDALVRAKVIAGDDAGRFNPKQSATRQEAAKLIYMMLALYVDR